MMIWRLHRRVLCLLCGAAVLLAGCVSKGKYTELESQYTNLQGQYTTLQGQYQQLQQSSTAQAARSADGNCRPEAGAGRRQGARQPVAGRYQVHRQQRLVVPVGLLGDVQAGAGCIAKLAPPGAVSVVEDCGERLYG